MHVKQCPAFVTLDFALFPRYNVSKKLGGAFRNLFVDNSQLDNYD